MQAAMNPMTAVSNSPALPQGPQFVPFTVYDMRASGMMVYDLMQTDLLKSLWHL